MRLKGKIDLWFWIVMLLGEGAILMAFLSPESWIIGGVTGLIYNLAFLPFVFRNYVEVTEDEVVVVFGFGRYAIPISELTSVYTTHNPIASTAASFDRIVLKGRQKELMCAVQKKEDFFTCLQEKRPDIKIEKDARNHKMGKLEKGCILFTLAVFVVVGFYLFTGNINVIYHETSFTIEASYWKDKEISYEEIEKIEYCDHTVKGKRVGGFGSFRLLMGNFRNEEFGKYKNYTYTSSKSAVVLWIDGEEVVIAGKDKESTREIYEELQRRCKE